MEVETKEDEMREIMVNLDIKKIRDEVFALFSLSSGLDAGIQLKKIQYYYTEDVEFQNYIENIKKTHNKMISLIFEGYKFAVMENNPLLTQDPTFGIPKLYYQLLQEVQEEEEANTNIAISEYKRGHMNRGKSKKEKPTLKLTPEEMAFETKKRAKQSMSPSCEQFGLEEESLAIKTTNFINSKDLCISPIEISRE